MRLDAHVKTLMECAVCHVYCNCYTPLVRAKGKTIDPSRRAHLAEFVRRGLIGWTEDVVEAMYASLNSRVTRVWCTWDIDETDFVRAARVDIVEAGAAPAWVLDIAANVEKTGNPYGVEEGPANVSTGEIAYLPGVTSRIKQPEIGDAFRAICRKAGIDLVELRGDSGFGLYDLGLEKLGLEQGRSLIEQIKRAGAKKLVCDCPADVYGLTRWLPAHGIAAGVEVVHHSVFLDGLAKDLRPGTYPKRVTFHDPSYLGRYLGVYDEPRRLLQALPGIELVEMTFSREKANPSGPLIALGDEKAVAELARLRASEAAHTGAQVVVTASPSSKRNLLPAARELGLEVKDIAEVWAEVL